MATCHYGECENLLRAGMKILHMRLQRMEQGLGKSAPPWNVTYIFSNGYPISPARSEHESRLQSWMDAHAHCMSCRQLEMAQTGAAAGTTFVHVYMRSLLLNSN